ncbi:phenylacetaldehyde dehydrogenase [Amycolatopsis bartoniae]|uniref:Aldehyde dehydrogenase n=1 Tax=Amycolatopsis bartoniae TaxID=941986 RepID=A0A8H9IZ56_9PSEU|nr:aldehyde dehydrogenase family protein [Amycolatopsis bartoniae]MBB2936531.1 phenylacetaldehyde dehydrogenase [Amycolatopsis bartoniae]TVT10994.1 aldehyde dehydrogenase family protein [Amycolatopsis bartoniae]GHF68252.1 aldehyde dehydrogenase [Amycolatopsis bartoniae]
MSTTTRAHGLAPVVASRLAAAPHLFIDGERREALSSRTQPVIDPGTGTQIATTACAGPADIDAAVAAAVRNLDPASEWRRMTPLERGRILSRIGEAIYAHADQFAELEVLDGGKVRGAARAIDVEFAARTFLYFAGWPSKIQGTTVPVSHPGIHVRTEREPVGVAGMITAWNFPLLLCGWKMAPALAAGCPVVFKASEETPLSALWLAELASEAGLPDGVLNVVPGHGAEAGAALVSHPDVRKLSFTGSTAVGRQIARSAADLVKRVTLELGGKSANIIFPDADLDAAVAGSAGGIFWHSGQTCSAPSRLFVHRDIHDEVVEKLLSEAAALTIGHGLDEGVDFGPLVSQRQLERVRGYVERAAADGAKVHQAGELPPGGGFFFPPTVIAGVTDEMECVREEIFGPVVVVLPFDDADEVARRANASDYGLAAGVWTGSVATEHAMTRALRAGTVYVNGWGLTDPAAPFGGFAQSGYGRDLGPDSLDGYLETKSVWTFHG